MCILFWPCGHLSSRPHDTATSDKNSVILFMFLRHCPIFFCFRPRTFSFQNGCMYGMDEHGLSNIIQYVFGMCLICYPENVNVHKWKKVDKMYIYIIQQQQAKLNTTLINHQTQRFCSHVHFYVVYKSTYIHTYKIILNYISLDVLKRDLIKLYH